MFIESLRLKNFRNYSDETFSFSNGINVLTGSNAQGKTNVAEAIFLLCTGYSPRVTRDKQVVKYGEERAVVTGKAMSDYGSVKVEIEFNKSDKKRIRINDLDVLRLGELLGNMHSIFFNPGELKLVQESPEDRRRFLNIALSQMSKTYFYALNRYNKILIQRNNLLKNKDISLIKETLPIWDEQLSKTAAKIIKQRNDFIKALAPYAEESHAKISDGKEKLIIDSERGYNGDEDEIASSLFEALKSSMERDIRLGFTNVGPHRDDIKIHLNDVDVKTYGSQGQQRTVALAIKLAEAKVFLERFKENPILILDDVLSELDKKRQRRLMKEIDGIQTILTCTNIDSGVLKNIPYRKILIENGKLKKSVDKC